MMDEKTFRLRLNETFDQIDRAFENIDPDLAECNQSQGSLSILFADRSKVILSGQPSVRQLWMAVTSKAMGLHFDYNEAQHQWMDDKGNGIEALSFLRQHTKETAQVDVRF